jgi:FdhD protein
LKPRLAPGPSPAAGDRETPEGAVKRTVERWREGGHERCEDLIAEEVPVALSYNGEAFAVMMLTPSDLEDFALGFSLTEGLVAAPHELLGVRRHDRLEGIELESRDPAGSHDTARAQRAHARRPERLRPCGSRRLEQVVRHHPPVGQGSARRGHVPACSARCHACAPASEQATGATHAAAWADAEGAIVTVREDVGRHNALDKLIGALRAPVSIRTPASCC